MVEGLALNQKPKWRNPMLASTPEQVQLLKLLSLKKALHLEMVGLKRRGKSANTIACGLLGLPKGTRTEVTMAKLIEHIG